MPRIRVHTTVVAPTETVWAYLADIDSHVQWMHDAVRIRFLTTRFECDTKVGPFQTTDVMEITEWKPGKAMGVRHVGLVTGSGRISLRKARGDRTKVTWTERLRFPLRRGGPVAAYVSKPLGPG